MTTLVMQPMRWTAVPDVDSVEALGSQDHDVLAEIAGVLRKHGCVDRFGVFLIHKHFDLSDDEIPVEYTDVENREQITVVEKRSVDPHSDLKTMETAWKFESVTTESVTVCVLRCIFNQGHKRFHVREGG